MAKRFFLLLFVLATAAAARAQQPLTLDSCRAMALRNNKTLAMSRTAIEKATYQRQAAHTNYLPKVALTAGYMRTGKEISLLNDEQKSTLANLGTSTSGQLSQLAGAIVQRHPELAPLMQELGGSLGQLGTALNGVGQGISDAFRTDTRNMTAAAIVLTQPLYMGGKIRAYDRITRYSEQVAGMQLRADEQQLILDVDQAYWQVVSLAGKRRLAVSYRDMLRHMDDDLRKMIAEGVATRANELTVSVKLNEAEMTLAKVEDGLSLSRMLLNQLCGLPITTPTAVAEERSDSLATDTTGAEADVSAAIAHRPELNQLRTAAAIYAEKVKVERAAFLPQLALTGGYLTTNPGLTNGFEKRFRGTWNVGLMLHVPLWNWGEARYKVRAARADATIASLRAEEVREKVTLQVHQSAYRVNEAVRKLALTRKNLEKAEENLRTAQVGFAEGVITTSDLLAAQTAWLQAHSDRIDAQVDVRLARATLAKATGTLR